jgi:hypothetical protein
MQAIALTKSRNSCTVPPEASVWRTHSCVVCYAFRGRESPRFGAQWLRVNVDALVLTIAGLATGTICAFAATRLVASMLVKVGAADPATFVIANLFLAAVALVATWLPARRATKIDPIAALRRS